MAAKKKDRSINEEQVKEWIERGVSKLENMDCSDKKRKRKLCGAGSGGGFWLMGFVGALVYFWQYVESFGTGIFAVIKAVFWPAFLVLHFFKFLKI
ncbi:hypothetical protein ACFL25_00035 [Patescibacteria group bacterium]